jgi:DNA-binding LacI/PurR family transcriptional regulator
LKYGLTIYYDTDYNLSNSAFIEIDEEVNLMSTTQTKLRYVQLTDGIRAKIQSGEWEEGDRLPSFAEMYREHGASVATMQKAYDQLEKEGFIERRARSGVYVTNPPSVQTGMLAFVVPEKDGTIYYGSSSYSMKLLHGAHQEATALGYQLALCNINQLSASDFPFSGCIVQGDTELIKACADFGKPVVSLILQVNGVLSVGTDDFAGFKAITNHLLNLGHRRISIIVSNEDDHSYPLRLRGYNKAFTESGFPSDAKWQRRLLQQGKGYVSCGYLEMQQWLREGWAELGCTAIVTQNDSTAIGVIKALRQHGYHVPQDVSVTGYDDSGEDSNFDLKLTTVHVPLEKIAQKAVCLLDQITTSANQVIKINLPTHMIKGESAAKLEGANFL